MWMSLWSLSMAVILWKATCSAAKLASGLFTSLHSWCNSGLAVSMYPRTKECNVSLYGPEVARLNKECLLNSKTFLTWYILCHLSSPLAPQSRSACYSQSQLSSIYGPYRSFSLYIYQLAWRLHGIQLVLLKGSCMSRVACMEDLCINSCRRTV